MDQEECYTQAGFRRDRGNASRLTTNDSIKARVSWLKKKAADAVVQRKAVDISEGLDILADIARGTAESENVEPHARISALNLIGKWSKWETGDQASNKIADNLSDEITAVRSRK